MTDYEILIAEQADSIRVREFSIKILQQKLSMAVEALERINNPDHLNKVWVQIINEALKKIKETK